MPRAGFRIRPPNTRYHKEDQSKRIGLLCGGGGRIRTIEAIPSVIDKGEVIFSGRKNGSDVERIVVGAPIEIGDKPYYMGVMLQRDSQHQRLYLHNVQIVEEATNSPQADLLTTGADGNYDRKNDRGVRINSRAEWGNLSEGLQEKVIKIVEDGVNRSENYGEIRLLLAALINKPVLEMTLKDKQTATSLLAQKVYSDMLTHRSLAELHWGILGEDVGKIVSELYQISNEVNTQEGVGPEFALGSEPVDTDMDIEERMRHYANVPEYQPGMESNGAVAEDVDVDDLLRWDEPVNGQRPKAGYVNVPKSEFEGTPHLRELGVQIENSVGDYWGTAAAVAHDKAAKQMKRQ